MKFEEIPEDIRKAAHRAGLTSPHWYVGPRQYNQPRKKTLADLAREACSKYEGEEPK